jgi:DNA-binding IclR family transcriptional regulator
MHESANHAGHETYIAGRIPYCGMATDSEVPGGIKSVRRGFEIIETLQALDGGGIKEIADVVDMPKSSVHAYLTSLKAEGYVIQNGHTYTLSLKFLDLGSYTRSSQELVDASPPIVDDLTDESGESAWLVVDENGDNVCIDYRLGDQAEKISEFLRQVCRYGTRFPLHQTAAGKAILANYPESKVAQHVSEYGLPSATEQTITDRAALFEELATIRDRGYAVNDQESLPDFKAVACPIFKNEYPVGAISIGGPASRMRNERVDSELAELLRSAANEIELKLAVDDH